MKRRGREYEYNDKQGLLYNFGLKISALRWKGAKNAEKERIDNIHSGKLDRQVVGAVYLSALKWKIEVNVVALKLDSLQYLAAF